MSTTTPTLLGINHDGPIIAESHRPRFTWTVQPEDFPAFIEHVNAYGGPGFWTITPAQPCGHCCPQGALPPYGGTISA